VKSPQRIIAIEEAFWIPSTRAMYKPESAAWLDRMSKGLLEDVGERRIKRMDEAGIDVQVLSHVQPGPQGFDREDAFRFARESNDWLGEIVKQYPTRFFGFAALPTQDPTAAADELERTVKNYGFKGGLINGHTQGHYLDEKPYWVIFERAQALDVPVYIHPSILPQPIIDAYFKDYPELAAAAWGWAIDTGTHLLRLICSGLFDAFPKVKVIVGHMGELIPFHMQRIQRGLRIVQSLRMKRPVADYFHDNIYITTSGVFEHPSLVCALATIGADHTIFSIDDPFADNSVAVSFLKSAPVSPEELEKLAHGNAERILKI
jgi:predicted TIM-barrel fold metal-dependent hydrolase